MSRCRSPGIPGSWEFYQGGTDSIGGGFDPVLNGSGLALLRSEVSV